MAVSQLSIFAENKPGGLVQMTSLLAKAGIDIRAMSLADTQDYGILRLIVSDIERAKEVLSENGFISSSTPVVAVALKDAPGALAQTMQILYDNNINVEYMYAFLSPQPYACTILRVSDNEKAEAALSANALRLLTDEDVSKM